MPSDILYAGEKEGFNAYVVEVKGEKQYFVEGYISTYDKDLVNDVVTKRGMLDVYEQADEIKADVEHEAFKPDEEGYGKFGSRDGIIPVAKIVQKRMDDVGVWVKAKLNPHLDSFGKLWGSIKDEFLDAFSIAFPEPQVGDFEIAPDGARLLNKLHLLNVALTGNPVNKGCKITGVVAKSRDKIFKEEKTMADEEKPVEEVVSTEPVKEEVTEVVEETKPVETEPSNAEAELKAISDRIEAIENRISEPKVETPKADYKSVLKKLDEIEAKLAAPVLKAEVVAPTKAVDAKDESFLQFVN